MGSAPADSELKAPLDTGGVRAARGVAGLLRLLGAGAAGSILLALGDGPLRTKDLTTRVPGYAPRTVYRYVGRLVEIGAVRREEEPGVPSKVVHHLTDPSGVELSELVALYATAALEELPGGGFVPHSWGSLTLLADLWETGMYEELTLGPCTATELARVGHDLSFHQVNRRTNLFLVGGLIQEANHGQRRRHYELTDTARQTTALIARLGLWRERHVVPKGKAGLTGVETGELLRAALPLVHLPEYAGKTLELAVAEGRNAGEDEEVVGGRVQASGAMSLCAEPPRHSSGWGRGGIGDWIQALAQDVENGLQIGGEDADLVKATVRGMNEAVWKRRRSDPSTP